MINLLLRWAYNKFRKLTLNLYVSNKQMNEWNIISNIELIIFFDQRIGYKILHYFYLFDCLVLNIFWGYFKLLEETFCYREKLFFLFYWGIVRMSLVTGCIEGKKRMDRKWGSLILRPFVTVSPSSFKMEFRTFWLRRLKFSGNPFKPFPFPVTLYNT